jgi:threonine dehydrogenase-like Zn-dependent dehydrogenase
MLKQAAIIGEREAVLLEQEMPTLKDGWALVKTMAAPMCAEYKGFVHGNLSTSLGHEAAGIVVATTPGSSVKVDERVVVMPLYSCGECELCRAGNYIHCEWSQKVSLPSMAQYIAKPSWLLAKIPDEISYEKASLACCGLGPSFSALEKMNVNAFTTLLITGLGPVGIGAVINAKFRGARVIAVEMNEYRQQLARELGVEDIIDPRDEQAVQKIKALTGGKGPDCGLDCSGVVAAHRLQIDAVRRLGKVAFVGECHDATPIYVSSDLIRKGISLIGSWHYNLNDFPKVMQVLKESPLIDKLITHTFPFSQIQQAFEVSAGQNCAKVILKPWEESTNPL